MRKKPIERDYWKLAKEDPHNSFSDFSIVQKYTPLFDDDDALRFSDISRVVRDQ